VGFTIWVRRKRLFADTPSPAISARFPEASVRRGCHLLGTGVESRGQRTTLLDSALREGDESRGTRYSERHFAQIGLGTDPAGAAHTDGSVVGGTEQGTRPQAC
jgi:hypothetical protein